VVGGSPTWRRGLAAILADAGFAAADLDDLGSWKPGRDGIAVMVRIDGEEARGRMRSFSNEFPLIPVVAVVPELNVGEYANAVRAGAAAAIGEDEPAGAFPMALESALLNRAPVPVDVLRAMAARVPATPEAAAWIDAGDAARLRALAAGVTVAQMADDAGYSEREMFRMLQDLYVRIGVRNRTEAIIWATRHGLLDEDDLDTYAIENF
jgi:DNA-binding NarL/FixJ family response regulator